MQNLHNLYISNDQTNLSTRLQLKMTMPFSHSPRKFIIPTNSDLAIPKTNRIQFYRIVVEYTLDESDFFEVKDNGKVNQNEHSILEDTVDFDVKK